MIKINLEETIHIRSKMNAYKCTPTMIPEFNLFNLQLT